MWIFQEWGGKVLEEIFHFKSQKSPHPPVPLLSTLHGWYRNNPPLCSDGLGTEPWFLPAFSNPTCFCHFSLTLSTDFFPRNKHLSWNPSIIFYKCQNHWDPAQNFRIFSNPASASSACPTGLSEFPLQNQEFAVICFPPFPLLPPHPKCKIVLLPFNSVETILLDWGTLTWWALHCCWEDIFIKFSSLLPLAHPSKFAFCVWQEQE